MNIYKEQNDRIFASRFHHRTAKFIDKYGEEHGKFETPEDAKAMLSAVLDFYTSNRLDRFPTEVQDMITFVKALIENLGEHAVKALLHDLVYDVNIFINQTTDLKAPGGKLNRWRIDINEKIALEFDVSPTN